MLSHHQQMRDYVWDETDGNLVSFVFVTCIIIRLRNFDARMPEIYHIIIYSDGCFYQSRNTIWSNALVAISKETDISINKSI